MSTSYCSRHKCKRTAHGNMSAVTRRPLCEICWGAELDGMRYGFVDIAESEETKRGEYLIEVCRLRLGTDNRVMLGNGFHSKTPLGLFRTLKSIILQGHTEERGKIQP